MPNLFQEYQEDVKGEKFVGICGETEILLGRTPCKKKRQQMDFCYIHI